ADQQRTRSGAIMGTPAYMAPEQADGLGRSLSPLVDVYALGAVLYECLTGQAPFVGENCWEVIQQVIGGEPRRPSYVRPRLARDLDTICLKALAKEPARRYASAADLAADLERFMAGEAISAQPESRWRRLGRRLRRRPITIATILLLAGAMALGGM